MATRYGTIGIKQTIRLEWMEKTVNLLLAGLDEKTIRQELHEFLSDRKGNGTEGKRSVETRGFVVGNLMKIWVTPYPELINFRDTSIALLQKHPSMSLPIHWSMISAVYPFWFNTAKQIGRLLKLQGQVTRAQIVSRLKEQYGDRQTVSRHAQFVIRSFIAWNILKDSSATGCYEKTVTTNITDIDLAVLMFESAILASPTRKGELQQLLNNPFFFPFHLPTISSEMISGYGQRFDTHFYGTNEVTLILK